MYLIKIELSKITYSFQILFKLELKLLLFCCFPHVTKEINYWKMCLIKFFYNSMSFAGFQINPIDVNFHLQYDFQMTLVTPYNALFANLRVTLSELIPREPFMDF